MIDLEKYFHSSLFHPVYLTKDLPLELEAAFNNKDLDFNKFVDKARALFLEHKATDREKWDHSQTLTCWIEPLLKSMGWLSSQYSGQCVSNFQMNMINKVGDDVAVRPSYLFMESEDGAEIVRKVNDRESQFVEVRNYAQMAIATSYFNSWSDRHSGKYSVEKDQLSKRGDLYTSLGPNSQICRYAQLFGTTWNIATDGATWRLYNSRESIENEDRYYEFNLQKVADDIRTGILNDPNDILDILRYFYFFFSRSSLQCRPIPFVTSVYENAHRYLGNIVEDMKGRFMTAMTIACNGYLDHLKKEGTQAPENGVIQGTAESLIFNILFIRSCESKRILPMHQDYILRSLSYLIRKCSGYRPDVEWAKNSNILGMSLKFIAGEKLNRNGDEIYQYIRNLNDLIQLGTGKRKDFGFEIEGFIETVFNEEELGFYSRNSITNEHMIRLLFELSYSQRDNEAQFQEIPYAYFSANQLGTIYESFLEYDLKKVKKSDGPKYLMKKTKAGTTNWLWINKDKLPKKFNKKGAYNIPAGHFIFEPGDERKKTGSYYTPDPIVDYIVSRTVNPLVKNKTTKEICDVKICDPAMGSGHFLLSALNTLAEAYLNASSNKKLTIGEAKRIVVNSCLFGVDINPRATKLAKLSLWLASAYAGKKLKHLDDQLKTNDSLDVNVSWEVMFPEVFSSQGFDSVIGNPPYVHTRSGLLTKERIEYLRQHYESATGQFDIFSCFFEVSIDKLLRPSGHLGFIVPKRLLSNENFEPARSFLLKTSRILEVLDAGMPFQDANVEACTIICNNSKNSTGVNFKRGKIKNGELKIENDLIPINGVKKLPFSPLLINCSNEELDLISKISEASRCFGDIASITRGAECGMNDPAIQKKKNSRPLISGKHINKFSISHGGDYLHLSSESKTSKYKPDSLYSKIPKLLIRFVAVDIVSVVDRTGFWNTNSIYNVHLLKDEDYDSIAALLNSRVIGFWFRKVFDNDEDLFPHIQKSQLKHIPVPQELIFSKYAKQLSRIGRDLVEDPESKQLNAELNHICFKMFKLTKNEIAIIDNLYGKLDAISSNEAPVAAA